MAVTYMTWGRVKHRLWHDANAIWMGECMIGSECVWFVPGTVDPME